MPRPPKFARSFRFRLALSYVLVVSVLLVTLGLLFRQNLATVLESETRNALEEEWAAVKGYLTIENQRPVWFSDPEDPEEAFIVERLRHVYLLTDSNGNVLQHSETYKAIGFDSAAEIREVLSLEKPVIKTREDNQGIPYLIKQGALPDDRNRKYFLAIGRSLDQNRRALRQFTVNYFIVLPALIALSGGLGWWLAGRAIEPVNSVARTAQQITGARLNMHIPLRGAGDELDHLIDTFNRMVERLRQNFDQIRQFSTDVSHELRTPLTAIRGQLEVALFTAEKPEQYREAMVNALQDVEHLSNIVRALLLLSQAESGQLALQKSRLDLAAITADVVDQFQIPAEAEKITLSAKLPGSCPIVGDATQIARMLTNLLSNAVKYTPDGGSIRVGLESVGHRAVLSVEDTGVGIPAENLPHIFDRFYRVRDPRTQGVQGLGLGLSFVSWIVHAHGGSIDVTSSPAKGSRFVVSLPLAPEDAPPAIPARQAPAEETSAAQEKLH